MLFFMRNFFKNKSGATAIEYGLIASLIAVVIVAAVTEVGTGLKDKFESIRGEINKKR
ncbi:MAG: Flp family type IVb pilin [Candidatus Liberibacter europaeus]|uniref:Flp family type IVb pilin n=1 Tax=Candidatus Liberibacter europaeus TaxID=744859 RepID=A0A2T4VZ66_9HYPH|nr:Flp family type IVb pilin [Candidatus Liberibacter europaeus]PTL87067.1 MAG: Flp family type IVb pilin [Candidatus Liberibacter europaeus]